MSFSEAVSPLPNLSWHGIITQTHTDTNTSVHTYTKKQKQRVLMYIWSTQVEIFHVTWVK